MVIPVPPGGYDTLRGLQLVPHSLFIFPCAHWDIPIPAHLEYYHYHILIVESTMALYGHRTMVHHAQCIYDVDDDMIIL